VAVALIVAVALLEGIGMLISLSPSNLLDHFMADAHGDTGTDHVLGWLYIGKVPTLVLVVVFLTGYALFGYAMQMVAHGLFGGFLPAWIAGLLAIPASLAAVRSVASVIAGVLPKDESSAVSELTLIGRAGVVCTGVARSGLAAQVRVRDSFGRTHYLMVEPDIEGEVFEAGAQVLIVRKIGAFYRCIANPHPALL
jgi:hypothetical protein